MTPAEDDTEHESDSNSNDTFTVGDRLTERNGGYSRLKNDEWVEVANFQLDPVGYLRTSGGWIGSVIVRTPDGERDLPAFVRPGDFNSKTRFKNAVVTGAGTTFRGGERDLNALKRFVAKGAAVLEGDA